MVHMHCMCLQQLAVCTVPAATADARSPLSVFNGCWQSYLHQAGIGHGALHVVLLHEAFYAGHLATAKKQGNTAL